MYPKVDFAIIGAGLAGATAASHLAASGASVCVLEKSRGAGGRMATRRTADPLQFDHGAQYFTVRDDRFVNAAKDWETQGRVALWEGRIVEWTSGKLIDKTNRKRYVATPTMNVLCKALLSDLQLLTQAEVQTLERDDRRWRLISKDGNVLCDAAWVISTAPAQQTTTIMTGSPTIVAGAAQVRMLPCWAAMIAPETSVESANFDGAFINQGPLRWVARNSSKPGRDPEKETWVLHAASEWSESHWENERESVATDLWRTFLDLLGSPVAEPAVAVAHRWRYALAESVYAERYLIDAEQNLAACGDWCGGPRVEGAYLSGLEASKQLLQLQ